MSTNFYVLTNERLDQLDIPGTGVNNASPSSPFKQSGEMPPIIIDGPVDRIGDAPHHAEIWTQANKQWMYWVEHSDGYQYDRAICTPSSTGLDVWLQIYTELGERMLSNDSDFYIYAESCYSWIEPLPLSQLTVPWSVVRKRWEDAQSEFPEHEAFGLVANLCYGEQFVPYSDTMHVLCRVVRDAEVRDC